MADSLPMMPWFPRDFLASTLGWSVLEQGLYRILLDAQWELGSLPNEAAQLQRIARATADEFALAWPCVCQKFASGPDGRLRNDRLEEHRAKSFSIRESRSKAGRIGGIAKAVANAKQMPSKLDGKPDSKILAPSPSEEREELNPAARPNLDLDPDAELLKAGAQILGGSYSLLQRLRTTHGDELVLRKIADFQAMTEKPRDPKAYFLGVMKKLERRFQA